jgi:hypothetical protein
MRQAIGTGGHAAQALGAAALLLSACGASTSATATSSAREHAPADERASVTPEGDTEREVTPREDAPSAEGALERPAVPEPPAEETSEARTPFEPPSCDASAPPADALDALMTPGNVHRYLAYHSWHWAIRAVYLVEERVVEARPIGRATVARGEVRALACLGSEEECGIEGDRFEEGSFVRIRRGRTIERADFENALPTSTSELETLARESALDEVPARVSQRPACWRTGCGSYDVRSDPRDATQAWLLPHVGLAAWSVGDYSPETGDGTAVTRVLVAWSLRTPVPSVTPGAAPRVFDVTRDALREVVAGGDVRALQRSLADETQLSLHVESSDPPERVVEMWERDESRSWLRLGRALDDACAGVGATVVCPASEAMPLARTTGGCAGEVGEAPPRALFVRAGSGFRLAALLVGGEDDLWSQPSWASRPARPFTQRARFLEEMRAR